MRQFPHGCSAYPPAGPRPILNPVRHHLAICVTGDGSLTLTDLRIGQSYHSTHGALTESRQVFVDNTGVSQRLTAGKATRVLEIGFGTGLNFCLTAALAREHGSPLHYSAFENAPLANDLLIQLQRQNFPDHPDLIRQLDNALAADGTLQYSQIDKAIALQLYHQDALESNWSMPPFDAIYLDAFSIDKNPALWQASFLTHLATVLKPAGVIGTFGVNRRFREALEEVGLQWRKLPGPPGKREVMIAAHTARALQHSTTAAAD